MLASVGVSVSHDPESRPGGHAARGRRGDVPRQARGRRTAWSCSTRACAEEVSAQLEIEDRLRHALPRHELLLAYQPILPLAGGRAVGCEALVRWHPARRRRLQDRRPAALGVPAAGRGERADRPDRRLGAARRLRAGRRLAPRGHRDPDLRQRLRARADRARSRRAGARGARAAPGCRGARCAWRSARRPSCATPSARARR